MKWVMTYIAEPTNGMHDDVFVADAGDLGEAIDETRELVDEQGWDADPLLLNSAISLELFRGKPLIVPHFDVDVDWPKIRVGGHRSPESISAAADWSGSKGSKIYAITGTESEDDLRFVQVLEANSLDKAIKVNEEYFEKSVDSEVNHIYSVVEVEGDKVVVWNFLRSGKRLAQWKFRIDGVPTPTPTPSKTQVQDLELIQRYRAKIGMRPLDPVAAGWQPEDIMAEAQRIRTMNPRVRALLWSLLNG